MAGINNNLYPPIFKETYMPAFVRTSSCRIYFSLSSYNSREDIRNVQVVICNQNNNISVLKEENFPTGVMIADIQTDDTVIGDAKYYIEIAPECLEGGEFELNQYYKVQIRFTGIGAASLDSYTKVKASWLTENQNYFSEWSTVCLIKGIQQPSLYIQGFEEENKTSSSTILTTEVVDFVGKMYYEENGDIEKEYLKYYRIKIYNESSNKLLFDSEDIYTNEYNPNEINYNLPYSLEDGVSYRVEIIYTTNNEYISSNTYVFSVVQASIDTLDATITATEDIENGRIKIDIVSTISESFLGNITIRRTSNKSNFTIWEDINTVTIGDGTPLNYTWYDYTIESGVWYKYAAQKRNSKGSRGTIIQIRNPIMMEFESVFLTNAEMQLKIKFDASISSFQKTLSESKTDTIGSKYPYFRRNGNVGYRQFSLSGLITAFCDEEGIFLSKDIIYGDMKSYYEQYNEDNDINEYQDYIYEREFREKVMDFLYNNDVKLFRSNTEGNILVKLMDISFTPNETLGRMLYSFSATAYEIDKCSLSNYDSYKIQELGEWSNYLEYSFEKLGQITDTFKAKTNVLTSLQSKYESIVVDDYLVAVNNLTWVKLEFESDPYLIKTTTSGDLIPLVNSNSDSELPDKDTAYGYIVYINNIPIIVSKRGYYELKDEDTKVSSISFPVETSVTINYVVNLIETEDTSKIASKLYYYTKVGQISGIFEIENSVYKQIYIKYLENYKAYYQKLVSINKLILEAIPGTIVYIKDSFDDTYYRHLIGPTGILELYDEDTTISQFYFSGVHLYEVTDTDYNKVRDEEFINTGLTASSAEEITKPIKNGVYTIDSQKKIYYQDQWYNFSDDNDVLCPVEAVVDYIYELIKGEY